MSVDLKSIAVLLGGVGMVAGLSVMGRKSRSLSDGARPLDDETVERLREIAHARITGDDPAHDALHVDRVAVLARTIAKAEGADPNVVAAAAFLHELVNLPKNHPHSHQSGDLCAEEAARLLDEQGVQREQADRVVACIRDHAFSKGAKPSSIEVAVLQDADRLDAIGAIGIARCFATASQMKTPFYSSIDPFCRTREPDDKKWATDHFFKKLLNLGARMNTRTGSQIAEQRTDFMRGFLREMQREIEGR